MAFGPEEVEEETRAEDSRNRNADENVIGSNAYVIIIVYVGSMIRALLDSVLLVNIVCDDVMILNLSRTERT